MPNQSQFGNENRCAGNDYYEINIINSNWDERLSLEELDKHAINNEKYFYRRFKFDAPKEQRILIIDIKNLLDLTDKEIISLKKSGVLTICKGKQTSIYADGLIILLGVMGTISWLLISSQLIIGLYYASAPIFMQVIGICIMSLFLIVQFLLCNEYCFKPISILRKRGISLGKKLCMEELNPI